LTIEQIKNLIVEAGRDPVERDTVYRRVHRNPDNFKEWTLGEDVPVLAMQR
jgi:aminodeoxyfutalosine synthase